MKLKRVLHLAGVAVLMGLTLPSPIAVARELKPFIQSAIQDLGASPERLSKITSTFEKLVAEGKVPGAVIVIARKGQIVYNNSIGFLDKASKKPMTPDAIFRIYSMTKPLVSLGAMMLVEDGIIQLNDPVSKYLPAFKDMKVAETVMGADGKATYPLAPAKREIIVQDLLRHTAGFAYAEITKNEVVKQAYIDARFYTPNTVDYDQRTMTPAEQVERMAKIPLLHQPGTTFEYGMAVDMLGRVVEAASGKRLSAFLDERIFKPLKMTDTAFFVPEGKRSRVAEPLPVDPATGQPNRLLDVSAEPQNDSGGAGAVSTASDYLRFCQMLLDGGELDGIRLVSPSTIRLMTADHFGTKVATPLEPGEVLMGVPGYTFGLGFAVRKGDGIAGVPGSAGEFMWAGAAGTFFWVDPREDMVVVMMMQSPGPTRPYYRRLIKALVYQAMEK